MGLSAHAICLYTQLLDQPSNNMTEISRALGIHRPYLYKALEELIAHELCQPKSQGEHHIRLTPPELILNKLKQQRIAQESVINSFNMILPNILSGFEKRHRPEFVTTYYGLDKCIGYYEQILIEASSEILSFGDIQGFGDFVGGEYVLHWSQRRVSRGIPIRTLSTAGQTVTRAMPRDAQSKRTIKLLPRNIQISGSYELHNGVTSIWNPLEAKIVVIRDNVIYSLLKSQFELIWTLC